MTPLDAALAAIPADMEPYARARLQAMVVGYDTLWSGEDVEVLAVEREFRFPLKRPDGSIDPDWMVSGRCDLIARWNGRVVVIDHKTSSEDVSPTSIYRSRLTLNAQATQYVIGAESMGFAPDGFVFGVLSKPALRPLKANKTRKVDESPSEYRDRCVDAIAATPEDYFARIEVPRLAADRELHLRDLWRTATLIDTVREYGLETRNPDACFHYSRPCQYFDACSGVASIDDITRYRRKEVPTDNGRRLLSNSRRAAFGRCHEFERLAFHVGVETLFESDTLSFGTNAHLALEHFWNAWPRQGVTHAAA